MVHFAKTLESDEQCKCAYKEEEVRVPETEEAWPTCQPLECVWCCGRAIVEGRDVPEVPGEYGAP